MTYCVGILLDEGLVMVADSRTNAGPDRIATFQKLWTFEEPGERVFALCAAGNLSVSQSVISVLEDSLAGKNDHRSLRDVQTMYQAAREVGRVVREVYALHGTAFKAHDIEFNVSFLLGGQIRGRKLRLYEVYAAGNFIEASVDSPFLQIGEVKYGKPVLDRVLTPKTSLADAIKCALISFDSTMRSNVTVGPPIDLAVIRRDTQRLAYCTRLEEADPYWRLIRDQWSEGLHRTFSHMPNPDWPI